MTDLPPTRRQNLELKFRCPDLAAAEAAARQLGARFAGVLVQRDLFFPAPLARLKLRFVGNSYAELISYIRPDAAAARLSDYTITPVTHPTALIATLTHALGQPRELKKSRRLYLHGDTRIHLDTVESLGTFVELETVMNTQSPAQARHELATIVTALHLADPIPTAYVDLL